MPAPPPGEVRRHRVWDCFCDKLESRVSVIFLPGDFKTWKSPQDQTGIQLPMTSYLPSFSACITEQHQHPAAFNGKHPSPLTAAQESPVSGGYTAPSDPMLLLPWELH